ncbi:immunoglobulin-binding protein 1 [Anoplophora glabripennis]|uniref:immunoglobulin-binding protein 1 n=1 Tax=Anoplophora glabripennis TaxID=217634 RepID=UPI0008737944|nr:immunoglobulin-binding protein 1 [Anoplophora glabripennis]
MANGGEDLRNEVQSLSSLFKDGLDNYNSIMNNDQPTNNPDVQMNIKKTMKTFEQATRLVSLTDIFSKNEGIEEVATNDLQYFLLPAFLGGLSLKLTSGERKDIVDCAEIYYKDFLGRCNNYGLSNYQFGDKENNTNDSPKREKSEFEQLEMAVNTRANKIQRFKEQKELKSRLQDLKKNMENEYVDEEIKRNYFLTMIKLFIHEAIDELNSIDMEKPILEHIANMKKDDKPQPKRPPPPPLKPIIITKDEVQKAVYGAGYPSLPTMTVQEFYDKRVEEGIFPDPNKKKTGPLSLQEAALAGVSLDDDKEEEAKENLVEEDDEEYIARMRAKDEYKDDHRRGWGNRMNRS